MLRVGTRSRNKEGTPEKRGLFGNLNLFGILKFTLLSTNGQVPTVLSWHQIFTLVAALVLFVKAFFGVSTNADKGTRKKLLMHAKDIDVDLYCMGRLEGRSLDVFEEHLLICEKCQLCVEQTDALIEALRIAPSQFQVDGVLKSSCFVDSKSKLGTLDVSR